MHRISAEDVIKAQNEYKKKYKDFVPLGFSGIDLMALGNKFANCVRTQNGQDTDDYVVDDVVNNNKVSKYLQNHSGRLLLLGVGTGREVLAAKDIGFKNPVGITLGSRNIDYGRGYLGLTEEEFIEHDWDILPFEKETFNVVAGFQVFEHAIAPMMFLLEQGRVLKTGGHIVLEWPPANEQFTMGENPHHQVCYTPGQAKALLMKAGFADVKVTYRGTDEVPEEEYWCSRPEKGDLVIEGRKIKTSQEYILRAWE